LNVRQLYFQNLFVVPACVVQIQEAHLINASVFQENFEWAQVGMNELIIVQHLGKINNFKNEVDCSNFREDCWL
jgi:hypothetical protein